MITDQRNLSELRGATDRGLPRIVRNQTTDPAFLDGASGRTVIPLSTDPTLPFFKIWASVATVGTAAGWVYRAELRLRFKGRIVDKLNMDMADQTQAMTSGAAPAVSDFVSGVGTPSEDALLFNSNLSGAGAVSLAPRKIVGVHDSFEVAYLSKSLCTGAYIWLRVEQSNYQF
jgi:hypothetical protein